MSNSYSNDTQLLDDFTYSLKIICYVLLYIEFH